jgi:hypothetical protein
MVSIPAFVQNARLSLAHRRSPSSAAHLDSLPAHTATAAAPTGPYVHMSNSEADDPSSEPAPHVVVPLTPRSDLDSTLSRSTSRAVRRPEEAKRQNETEQDRLQGLMRSATVRRVESRQEQAPEEGDRWLRAKVWLRQDGEPSGLDQPLFAKLNPGLIYYRTLGARPLRLAASPARLLCSWCRQGASVHPSCVFHDSHYFSRCAV